MLEDGDICHYDRDCSSGSLETAALSRSARGNGFQEQPTLGIVWGPVRQPATWSGKSRHPFQTNTERVGANGNYLAHVAVQVAWRCTKRRAAVLSLPMLRGRAACRAQVGGTMLGPKWAGRGSNMSTAGAEIGSITPGHEKVTYCSQTSTTLMSKAPAAVHTTPQSPIGISVATRM